MRKGFIQFIILGVISLAMTGATVYSIQKSRNLGNLQPLEQFTSTTSPYGSSVPAITQRSFGKPLYITGLNTGECVEIGANGVATTSGAACGSGAGGGSGGTWSTTTSGVSGQFFNYPNNNDDIVIIGSNASTTAEVLLDPNIQSYRIGSSNTASTTIIGNATTTGSHGAGAILVNGDYITDFTGTGLSVSGGVLNSTASGDFPFTVNTGYNSTSTTIGFLNGLFSTASSTFSGDFRLSALSNGGLGVFGGLVSSGATTTAGTGLTYSGNAFNVNTTQNIAKLSNLTSNGFVKTSGGDGTLSVDTTTYESGLTAGDGLTRTSNDFDCDTANGSTFGCLSSTDWTTFNNKLSSYDAWTHPTYGGSATTSLLTLSNGFLSTASSTIVGNATTTGGQYAGSLYGAGLGDCDDPTNSKLLWSDTGQFSCGSDQAGAGGSVDGTGVANALAGWVDSNTIQATGTVHALYVPAIYASTTDLNTFKGDVEVGTENGGPFLETGGSDATPPFTFRNDKDTGMYSAGVNALGFSTGGANRLTISSTGNLTFGYSSSTVYSSFLHASTTNLTFGGVTADTWPEFCTSITGSADLCDGSDASGSGGSAYEIATTSDIAVPQVAYFTKTGGLTTIGSIATGTLSVPTGLTITGSRYVLGGSATIGLDTGYVIPLQSTLDGKEDDLTFNWPLLRSTNTISWGGLSTTTNLTTGHIPFVSGANTFSSRATTSASCSGSVSCSAFDILGSSPITITGTDSTASSTLLGDTNSWTGVNRFSLASTTYHSFVTASTTNLIINGESFNDLTGTGLAISGNALVTSNIPNASLTNSTISGISLGSNLADLTATNGTLTFSGTYNGGTARTIGLNLGNANVWTAKQDLFGSASSTLFSANWGAFGSTGTTTINTLGQLLVGTTTPWLNSMTNIVGTTTVKGQFATLRASTTAATTQSIDWSTGNFQDIMLTGNTNIVVNSTSSNPLDGGKYTLRVCQDPTGSRTLTWANPTSLRWWNGTTTISSAANKCTMIGMIYSGTNGNNIYSIVASSTGIDIR